MSEEKHIVVWIGLGFASGLTEIKIMSVFQINMV